MNGIFQKQTALPQDHGSWVFILSPLFVGFFAGGKFTFASFALFIAAMSAFMMRQPLTIAVKSISGRRPRAHLFSALVWSAFYCIFAAVALTFLIAEGFAFILYLAVPGIPVFIWHLWLVSRREERRQVGVEIVATGALSLAAAAAYWVGIKDYNPMGWTLSILCWAQTAASILYAYLRLDQRPLEPNQARARTRREKWSDGIKSFAFVSINVVGVILLSVLNFVPKFLFVPFLIQWIETAWGIENPAAGWKPTRIGIRQLIVSIMWTISFIICWKI